MVAALRKDSDSVGFAPQAGRTPVYIVASPRAKTGKTFLARLLVGFYLADERPLRAYDLDLIEPTLINHAPWHTVAADLSHTQGQMALFDALIVNDGRSKVIDVPHLSYKSFFALAEQISFFEEARYHSIEPVILFPADLHPATPQHYAALQARFPRTILVPVQNEAIARIPKLRETYPTYRAACVPLHFPALLPALRAELERHNYSFADVHENLPLDIPIDTCFGLRSWTKRAFFELRELELRLLLEKLQSSLTSLA